MENISLEERVARLEGRLGWGPSIDCELNPKLARLSLLLLVIALLACWIGLGAPNHYYQVALGILVTILAYHKGWLIKPQQSITWGLAVLNAGVISLLFKLFIGSGERFPLSWIMYPVISKMENKEGAWKGLMPGFDLGWQPSPIADWSIDLTIVQTFLLLLTVLAAFVEFQPFASLIAVLLVMFSIPALVSFNWPWVFPAILIGIIALYLQSPDANRDYKIE
jgi:hypothetical protein